MTLSDLKPGDRGRVRCWSEHLPDRLLEMGLLPGTVVEVVRVAPLGDPMAVRVANCLLALRKEGAAHIMIDPE